MGKTLRLVDCTVCGENKLHQARDMCSACYQRLLREGKLEANYTRPRRDEDVKQRLLSRVVAGPDGCWIYTGKPCKENYCRMQVGPNDKRWAHRLSYQLFVGEIPVGYHIDHTCHSRHPTCTATKTCLHRRCVNPDHLEALTPSDHARLSKHGGRSRPTAILGESSRCAKGHAMTGENVVPRGQDRPGQVQCRTCRLDRNRRARARRAEMTADYALNAAARDSTQLHDPLAVARLLDQLSVAQAILGGLMQGSGTSSASAAPGVRRAARDANAALAELVKTTAALVTLDQSVAA